MKTLHVFNREHRLQRLNDETELARKWAEFTGRDRTTPVDWNFRQFQDNLNRLFARLDGVK